MFQYSIGSWISIFWQYVIYLATIPELLRETSKTDFVYPKTQAKYSCGVKFPLTSVSVNKVLLRYSHAHVFVVSSMAAFALQSKNGVIATEIYGLKTLNYLLSGPLEKCDDLCFLLNHLKTAKHLLL